MKRVVRKGTGLNSDSHNPTFPVAHVSSSGNQLTRQQLTVELRIKMIFFR